MYKMTLLARTKRVLVIADSFADLKEKALRKLGVPEYTGEAKVVMASDGTEVDEWEVLLELNPTTETFMLLLENEEWCAPSKGIFIFRGFY